MAEKVGDAYVEIGTRDIGLDRGLDRGLKKVMNFAKFAAAAMAGIAAGRGIAGLVGAYSDAEETVNKFNEVFNGATQDINKAADELAESYGMIGTSSRKLLADTGDILVGFGFTEDAALDLAVQTNQLATDLASFTNIEGGTAKASQALTKALVGETEQAKSLGIVIRQMSPEFKSLVKNFVEVEGKTLLQAKALAALEIATSQTKKAQGDYARTQDQLANQMRLTGERVQALKEATGGLLVQFLNAGDGVMSFNGTLETLADTLNSVTGAQIKTTKEIILFTAGTAAAYKGLQILIPALVTMAANISAAAAAGGIAAAVGSTAGLAAAAAGLAAIVVQLVKMRHATNPLLEINDNLADSDARLRKSFGTDNLAVIKGIREAIATNNEERLDYFEKRFPQVLAKYKAQLGSALPDEAVAPAAATAQKKTKGRDFSFGSFDNAIKSIQSSLGKGDTEKKQLKELGDINKGIQQLVKKPDMAVVGA